MTKLLASPICEKCFIELNIVWEFYSVNEDGELIMRMKSLESPFKINRNFMGVCAVCMNPTISGIYQLV